MWYKDEAKGSHTYAADSDDLYNWEFVGPVITDFPHEGPNVFNYKDSYWMIIDKWSGQAVYQSSDCEKWVLNNTILNKPGIRKDDGTIGLHADVHVQGDNAYIFYFTHPERTESLNETSYESKRTSIQAAKLDFVNGKLICDRNASFELSLKYESAQQC
ncbi:hypothetical protein [Bacillus sp. SA1-12]|uniref:hypothetical protein n=1 Tax=Bacillus sp. SA1-12 TaxID=1455638 RepID=UPI001E2EED5F|nr:hypothetical protein [Bacillus sp. SA1-12]